MLKYNPRPLSFYSDIYDVARAPAVQHMLIRIFESKWSTSPIYGKEGHFITSWLPVAAPGVEFCKTLGYFFLNHLCWRSTLFYFSPIEVMFLTLPCVVQAAGRLSFVSKGIFWFQLRAVFVAVAELFQVQSKYFKVPNFFLRHSTLHQIRLRAAVMTLVVS